MFDERDIPSRLLVRDEVLAILIQFVARSPGDFDAFALVPLSFDTSIRSWLGMFDAMTPRSFGRSLNETFGVQFSDESWSRVLTPVKQRTLGDVCDLLAQHARVTCVRPITLMGDTSASAGAFLAMRQILDRAGVDISDMRPSTELAPFLRSVPRTAFAELMRLAPGRMPPICMDAPFHSVCNGVTFASFLMIYVLGWLRAPVLATVFSLLAMISYLCGSVIGRHVKPRAIGFA